MIERSDSDSSEGNHSNGEIPQGCERLICATSRYSRRTSQAVDEDWLIKKQQIEEHSRNVVRRELQDKSRVIVDGIYDGIESDTGVLVVVRLMLSQYRDLHYLLNSIESQINQRSRQEIEGPRRCQFIDESDIKQIFLRVYEEIASEGHELKILLVSRILILEEKDLRLFDRSFKGKRFFIIIPTWVNLININSLGLSMEPYYIELYSPKNLFCQLFMDVIADQTLCAYLPKEALSLIQAFDKYPITFMDGVRRLTYLINMLHISKKKFEPVKFKGMVDCIIQMFIRKDQVMPYHKGRLLERLLITIMDDNHQFVFPRSIIENMENSRINIDGVAEDLKRELKAIQQTARFAPTIGNLKEQVTYVSGTRKHDRIQQFNVPKTVESKDVMLSRQLSLMIKEVTFGLRKQASTMPWSNFKMSQRIHTDIIRDIVKRITNSELAKVFKHTSNCIEKEHRVAFTQCDMDLAEYNKHVVVLDYLGVIEFSKKQINPTFYNQVFKKADFRML